MKMLGRRQQWKLFWVQLHWESGASDWGEGLAHLLLWAGFLWFLIIYIKKEPQLWINAALGIQTTSLGKIPLELGKVLTEQMPQNVSERFCIQWDFCTSIFSLWIFPPQRLMCLAVDLPQEPNKTQATNTYWIHHMICTSVPQGEEITQPNTSKYTPTGNWEIRADCQTCCWSLSLTYSSFHHIQLYSHLCQIYVLFSLCCHLYFRFLFGRTEFSFMRGLVD